MTKSGRDHPRFINLDGKKFGKLTIINSFTSHKRILVVCECGKEFETDKSAVISGHTTSCGKGLCRPGFKDLTGQKFEYITVLSFLETKNHKTWWNCQCECGKIFITTSHALKTKNSQSCGCKSGIIYSEKTLLPNNMGIINSIFTNYKNHAKKLNVDFLLSIEDFLMFLKQNCHYCGEGLSNIRKLNNLTGDKEFRYNGIDRKNSNIGYTIDNCVSSCKNCNYAKRKLSYEEFIQLAIKISKLHGEEY